MRVFPSSVNRTPSTDEYLLLSGSTWYPEIALRFRNDESMDITDEGMWMSDNVWLSWNAYSSTVSVPEGMLYVSVPSPEGYAINLLASWSKRTPSMVLKSPFPSETVMLLMYMLAKAPSPITETESGMCMDETIESMKAHSPMYLTVSGMVTVRKLRFARASSDMATTVYVSPPYSTSDGMIRSLSLSSYPATKASSSTVLYCIPSTSNSPYSGRIIQRTASNVTRATTMTARTAFVPFSIHCT